MANVPNHQDAPDAIGGGAELRQRSAVPAHSSRLHLCRMRIEATASPSSPPWRGSRPRIAWQLLPTPPWTAACRLRVHAQVGGLVPRSTRGVGSCPSQARDSGHQGAAASMTSCEACAAAHPAAEATAWRAGHAQLAGCGAVASGGGTVDSNAGDPHRGLVSCSGGIRRIAARAEYGPPPWAVEVAPGPLLSGVLAETEPDVAPTLLRQGVLAETEPDPARAVTPAPRPGVRPEPVPSPGTEEVPPQPDVLADAEPSPGAEELAVKPPWPEVLAEAELSQVAGAAAAPGPLSEAGGGGPVDAAAVAAAMPPMPPMRGTTGRARCRPRAGAAPAAPEVSVAGPRAGACSALPKAGRPRCAGA